MVVYEKNHQSFVQIFEDALIVSNPRKISLSKKNIVGGMNEQDAGT